MGGEVNVETDDFFYVVIYDSWGGGDINYCITYCHIDEVWMQVT